MKIVNKKAYHEACVELEELLIKGFEALSEQEDLRLVELSEAIEQWENMNYPMPIKPTFIDILNYLLKQYGLTKTELAARLDISNSGITQLFSGRVPSATVLTNLHTSFGLDGNLILESLSLNNER